MTEALSFALRYVDPSMQQTQQLPTQQLPSVPAQQHQPVPQNFMTPQRPMHPGTAAATSVCPGPHHDPTNSAGTLTESPHH